MDFGTTVVLAEEIGSLWKCPRSPPLSERVEHLVRSLGNNKLSVRVTALESRSPPSIQQAMSGTFYPSSLILGRGQNRRVLPCANVRSCPVGGFLLYIPHSCNVHERRIQHLTAICRYTSQEGKTDRQHTK